MDNGGCQVHAGIRLRTGNQGRDPVDWICDSDSVSYGVDKDMRPTGQTRLFWMLVILLAATALLTPLGVMPKADAA